MTPVAELLPLNIRAAASEGSASARRALEEIRQQDLSQFLLALWVLAATAEDLEYARMLAVGAASHRDSVALACQLWLMEQKADDTGVANTLLGVLEADAVERGQWSSVLGGDLFGFLRSCLRHPEPSVRAGVLSVLALARPSGLVAATFPAVQSIALADELERAVGDVADDEELADLHDVVQTLRGQNAVPSLPLAPRALSRVALDLLDWADSRGVQKEIEPLVDCVRRRALLDDAGVQAVRARRPIQTFRVLAEAASTRVVQAIVAFGDAVVGVQRRPDSADVSAPDYGTQMAWAPAASVPMHLLFVDDDARRAFTVLEGLVAAGGKPAQLDALVDGLDPAVAEALLGLIERLKQHNGRVEIVLTDPELPDWQRTVLIVPEVLGKQTVSRLMERTRSVAFRRGVVVYADHVPQANTVRQVFQAVDAMLERGVVTIADISGISTDRQVNYYKQGARILGFFDEDNRPTGRARAIADLSYDRRLGITAVFFEDTPIGRAWRAWAGKGRLKEVNPDSAKEFLETCVVGLSGSTPSRRSSTLERWFKELMPNYPDVNP
jgi:hypothetical protein